MTGSVSPLQEGVSAHYNKLKIGRDPINRVIPEVEATKIIQKTVESKKKGQLKGGKPVKCNALLQHRKEGTIVLCHAVVKLEFSSTKCRIEFNA
jgi:hypothetical protein